MTALIDYAVEPQAAPSEAAFGDLLQELCLALAGITGDVFVDTHVVDIADPIRSPLKCSFRVNQEAAWLNSCDRSQLEGVLKSGYHFFEIDRFVQRHQSDWGPQAGTGCWKGLCLGLEELCVVYRAAVLRMEQHVLTEAAPQMASVQHYLSEYSSILPGIHATLYELTNIPNATDAQIMGHLFDQTRSGIPMLAAVTGRLLWNCNQVLYRHISAWMVHGVLLKSSFNFFITCRDDDGGSKPHISAHGIQLQSEVASSWSSFELQALHVPKYIPKACPPKILDIGRAVRLLRNHPPDSPAPTGAPSVLGSRGGGWEVGSHACPREAVLTTEEVTELTAELQKLAAAPVFSGIAFEGAIDRLHEKVSGKVYSLVVNRAQLVPHLNAIKDYLLIGRCDFFSIFLEASADAMHRAPHPSTATPNLERAFHSAAARTGVDATAEFDCVGISWQAEVPAVAIDGSTAALVPAFFHAAPAGGDGREAPSWNGVVLTYTPPWPLPLLLTRDAMEVYEMLFRYLLAVERAVRALDEVWMHFMAQQRPSRRRRGLGAAAAAVLRHRMAHVVRVLRVFLKQDVVERGFSALRTEVAEATTFLQVQKAHASLLTRLKEQTFLTTPGVCEQIEAILQGAGLLCRAVVGGEALPVEDIGARFEANLHSLQAQLASRPLQALFRASGLLQALLLRLDTNSPPRT